MTRETIGVVENGRISLPASTRLPEGARVKVVWEEPDQAANPYEREPLTKEDVLADLAWATSEPRNRR